MSFPCPYLGTEQAVKQCNRPADTIRGFKKHLTHNHGGWTTDQIQTALDANPPAPEVAEETLFVDGEAAENAAATQPAERERTRTEAPDTERKGRKAAIRLSKAMSGLKDFVAKLIPHLTVGFLKTKVGIEGTLTEEAAQTLSESWAAYFDFLGIDIENIEPVKIKINGKKAMFLFPLSMVAMTLMLMKDVHRIEIVKDKSKKPEPIPFSQPVPVDSTEPPSAS